MPIDDGSRNRNTNPHRYADGRRFGDANTHPNSDTNSDTNTNPDPDTNTNPDTLRNSPLTTLGAARTTCAGSVFFIEGRFHLIP